MEEVGFKTKPRDRLNFDPESVGNAIFGAQTAKVLRPDQIALDRPNLVELPELRQHLLGAEKLVARGGVREDERALARGRRTITAADGCADPRPVRRFAVSRQLRRLARSGE